MEKLQITRLLRVVSGFIVIVGATIVFSAIHKAKNDPG